MLSSIAMPMFAEDAPVYDVDSYPPQFDGQQNQNDQQLGPQATNNQDQGSDTLNQPDQVPSPGPQSPSIAQDNSSSSNVPSYEPPPPNLSLDERMGRIEQQLSNAMHSDSFTKFTDMQTQIQALRGQIEELTHQLQLLQQQQKAMYADLEKRVNHSPTISEDNYEESGNPKSKTAAAKILSSTTGAVSTQPNSAEEQKIYQQAYSLIKAKKYSEAAATFETMLQKYPTGKFASNAHYWLGELYGLMGNNDKALTEFNTIVQSYPQSQKIADAQLKLGLIYSSQQKWSDAKSSFKKVVIHFPGTSFARLATEQLKQIKSSGH